VVSAVGVPRYGSARRAGWKLPGGAVGISKEAKLENVLAMTEAVFEYGVY